MLCKNPFMRGIQPCGCGQCLPCRINHRRKRMHRLLLERDSHSDAAFVTLTYRDEEVHHRSSDWCADTPVVGTLVPRDLQLFLKRLRKAYPGSIRFFAVGEYGEETFRPHYHLALFGFPTCRDLSRSCRASKAKCDVCSMVSRVWNKGHVDVGQLNRESAQYISGYITKKLTKEDQWSRSVLKGRHPEFARMSNGGRTRKGGIGAIAIKSLVMNGVRTRQRTILQKCSDAPAALRRDGSILPLDRYLKRKWREALGRSQETPLPIQNQYLSELHALYMENKSRALAFGVHPHFVTPRLVHVAQNKEKVKSLEKRTKIFQSRRPI